MRVGWRPKRAARRYFFGRRLLRRVEGSQDWAKAMSSPIFADKGTLSEHGSFSDNDDAKSKRLTSSFAKQIRCLSRFCRVIRLPAQSRASALGRLWH